MVVVWLNMTLFSMFVARYAKFYFKRQSLWFTIHKYSGMLSGLQDQAFYLIVAVETPMNIYNIIHTIS